MKIDFLVAENTYGSTAHFASACAHACRAYGITTRLHWVGEGHFFHAFYEILADPPDLTFSFSDLHVEGKPLASHTPRGEGGAQRECEKYGLGALWQIPHFFFLLDPAIYFLHQMRGAATWLSCVDEGEVDFVRALGFPRVCYLPHAGDQRWLTPPARERPYELVFFGSCAEYETEDEIVRAAAARVLSPEPLSIVQSLVSLGVEEEALPRYHAWVDFYTRFHDRVALLRALQGESLHIWGKGPWKKYVPHAHVHPPLPFEETLRIMQQARVVINSSPRFPRGLHERIVYASLCGAATLSTHPLGYTYTPGVWEVAGSRADWKAHAERAQEWVLAAHTWEARVATLLSFLKAETP